MMQRLHQQYLHRSLTLSTFGQVAEQNIRDAVFSTGQVEVKVGLAINNLR